MNPVKCHLGMRKRRRFMPNQYKRFGKLLEEGMQGILIICNQKPTKSEAEALGLLTEYADLLYGPEKQCEEQEEDDEGETAQTAPEKEVAHSRASTEMNLRRFQVIKSSSSNILFVRSFNIEPEKLVHHIFNDLYTTKKQRTKSLLRMLPVCGTCSALPEDFRRFAETLLQPWFKAPNKGNFQIIYKAKSTHNLGWDMVVDDLTGILHNLNHMNRWDSVNPDYTILVEVIRNVCCLGVVKDYDLFKKYNLQELMKSFGQESKETAQEVQDAQAVGSNA